ncbi:MAG: prepilin peptidase [Acetatifactor sp.]
MWQKGITGIWLLMLSVSDARKKSVPMWMLGLGIVGTAGMLLYDKGSNGISVMELLGSIWPGVLFLLIAAFTGNMGYGDGMVLILLGLMRGQKLCLIAVMVSLLIISIFAAGALMFKKAKRNTRIPFLPFLAVGWIIAECFRTGGV